MKKQKLTSIHLRFKKVTIAHLANVKGGNNRTGEESYECSEPINCLPTLTTRPDSLDPDGKNNDLPN